MKKLLGLLIAVCSITLMLLPTTSEAVIIDHFDVAQSLSLAAPGSISSSASGINILGTERDMTLELISGIASVSIDSNIGGVSLLSQSGGATVLAKSIITWDGIDGSSALDATGLGGVDLSDSATLNTVGIDVVFDDLPLDLSLSVYTDASNWSKATITLPGGIVSPTDYDIPFANFVTQAGAGADFANVGAVQLLINATLFPGTDMQIHFIDTEVPLVPEPGTMMLIGIGLIGVYGVSRKRK